MLHAQLFVLLNKATVVTMATKCNSHQQYSAAFYRPYLSCTSFFIIFGEDDQTGILNLLPHLQDPTSNTGWIITQTCTPSYITLITWIQHTTISQQSRCGIMQITLINVTQIYIHSVQETVNYNWNLFDHHSTTIMQHLHNIQTEVIVWYSVWQRPNHAPCQDACSVLIVHVSTKYFYNRN